MEQSAVNYGLPLRDDYNGSESEGVSRIELFVSATASAKALRRCYLRPAMARPNLTVETGALTTRILIEHGRAVGIEYRQDGQTDSGARRARGDSVRRLLQLAAGADAVRHRPGRSSGIGWRQGAARSARRRPESGRTSQHAGDVQGAAQGYLPEPASTRPRGDVRRALAPVSHGRLHQQRLGGSDCSSAASRISSGRTCSWYVRRSPTMRRCGFPASPRRRCTATRRASARFIRNRAAG